MHSFQRGQSYIELAVALLLISLSLTGVAVTMLSAQQLSRFSTERYDVALLMMNISNQLYLNSAEVKRKQSIYLTHINKDSAMSVNCIVQKSCQQRRQALADIQHWQQRLNQRLSIYLMVLCRDSTMSDGQFEKSDGCDNKLSSPLVIKLWWQSPNTNDVHFYALGHAA